MAGWSLGQVQGLPGGLGCPDTGTERPRPEHCSQLLTKYRGESNTRDYMERHLILAQEDNSLKHHKEVMQTCRKSGQF